jgi:uncharacterized membrane protein YccF (DUF307 family)
MIAFLVNILWFFLGGGLVSGLLWLLAGCLLFVTIIGIPFAFACFRIAGFVFFPFGRELVDARDLGEARIPGTTLGNILWFLLAGWWLFVLHVMEGVVACLSIIGIPFGIAHFKLALVSLAPLGKRPSERF